MSISTPFIQRPVGTSLLTVAIALAGILAFLLLPVAPLPEVEFPTIQVNANLPGGSPETMASSVATPLERQFGRIAGITEMTSSSTLGSTNITLQFSLDRDIDAAARDVQASINAALGQGNTTMASDLGGATGVSGGSPLQGNDPSAGAAGSSMGALDPSMMPRPESAMVALQQS